MLGFYGIKTVTTAYPSEGYVLFFCSKHSKTYYQSVIAKLSLSDYHVYPIVHVVCFRMPCIATRHDRVDTLPSDFSLCVIATDFILLSAHSIHFTLYSGSRCLFTLLIILPYTVYDKPLHVVTC